MKINFLRSYNAGYPGLVLEKPDYSMSDYKIKPHPYSRESKFLLIHAANRVIQILGKVDNQSSL